MSACNNYHWLSPFNWMCNAGSAVTSGLSSGLLGGVDHQVTETLDKLSERLGLAVDNAFAKMGDSANGIDSKLIGERVAKAARDFFQSVQEHSGVSTDAGEWGQKLGQNLKDFGAEFEKTLGVDGASLGGRAGGELNGAFNGFWDNANLKGNTERFARDLNEAFRAGMKTADLGGNVKFAADEVGEGMKAFREALFREIDQFRYDVQGIFANVARDTTLRVLPWVALGGVLLVGTPLLTMYVYKKAAHNIGRPQLAQEVRKVGVWDRTTDGISRATLSIWNSAKKGLKLSTLMGASVVIGAFTGGIATIIKEGRPGYCNEVASGLLCAAGLQDRYYCTPTAAEPYIAATIGAGLLYAGFSLAKEFYAFSKAAIKKDPEPIFNDELQKRIDALTSATYNINRNGGYLQNLLLYGPGGTGKTMISKYIAKNSWLNYVMMSGGDLAQYIKRGEHVTELNRLFDEAKNSHSPTILFIDECESLCGDRGKMDRSELIELVNCFLNQTGESDISKKVMIVLTTNRQEDLDPAVIDRMDHKIYVGLPELKERKKIINLYLPKFMTSTERKQLFTDSVITDIAEQIEGFSGRVIFKMLNAIAGMRAATSNNQLTEQMIMDTVKVFVKQENKFTVKPPQVVTPQSTSPSLAQESVEPIAPATQKTVDVPEQKPLKEASVKLSSSTKELVDVVVEPSVSGETSKAVSSQKNVSTLDEAQSPPVSTTEESPESIAPVVQETVSSSAVEVLQEPELVDVVVEPSVSEGVSKTVASHEKPIVEAQPSVAVNAARGWWQSFTSWIRSFFRW